MESILRLNEKIQAGIKRLGATPRDLAFAALGSIVLGAIGAVAVTIPDCGYYIDQRGREMTYAEFWRSGMGPSLFLFFLAMLANGVGLLRARCWSRRFSLALWVVIGLLSAIYQESVGGVVEGALGFAATYWYLYRKPAVTAYFAHFGQLDVQRRSGETPPPPPPLPIV